jgi:hypothetical protein
MRPSGKNLRHFQYQHQPGSFDALGAIFDTPGIPCIKTQTPSGPAAG